MFEFVSVCVCVFVCAASCACCVLERRRTKLSMLLRRLCSKRDAPFESIDHETFATQSSGLPTSAYSHLVKPTN